MRASRTEIVIVAFAILWYGVTAWYSSGYYHGDEQYQIIEFAGILDGTNAEVDMAWEYAAHSRSALQPVLAHMVFTVCGWSSIMTDPYTKAFVLRLLTGMFAVFCIHRFARSCQPMVLPRYWIAFLSLSFFLWFLPFISVRFSSETCSGLFLLLAVSFVLQGEDGLRTQLILGALLGIAFLFRYQSAIASLGLLSWVLLVRKDDRRMVACCVVAMLIIIAGGVALDAWFYGGFVLTPWNYLKTNLIEGVAGEYGTSPWYFYPYLIFRFAFFPIGIAILISGIWFFIKEKKHLITWVVVPYVVVHSFISHKELRFLFPIVYYVPFVLIRTLQRSSSVHVPRSMGSLARLVLLLLCVIDLVAMFANSLKPADIGRMRITRYVHEHPTAGTRDVLCAPACDPFGPWGGKPARFYMEPGVSVQRLTDLAELDTDVASDYLIIDQRLRSERAVRSYLERNQMRPLIQSMPEPLLPVLRIYGGFEMKDVLVLYGR